MSPAGDKIGAVPAPDPDDQPVLAGRLLVAAPQLDDPNFSRTVVLVLEHGDPGALGVVLNRPMHVEVGEILAGWSDLADAAPPGVIFSGGPVSPDAVIGLARPAGDAPGGEWREVAPATAVVDLSVAPADQPTPLRAARLFSGYAGWDAGQLEGEIEEGAWFVVDAVAADVLGADPDRLWHDVLQRQGGRLAMLAAYPPSPTVN